MSKFVKFILIFVAVFSLSFADEAKKEPTFSKKASGEPELIQEGDRHEHCAICGMSLINFYKTSHASHLHDGTKTQYCSIRCLVTDSARRGASLDDAMVVDVNSEKLIPANLAFYVVGSDVRGTMARVSKLAFSSENEANEFIKIHGGEIKNFAQALKAVHDEAEENKRNTIKRGEEIYKEKCTQIDVNKFEKIEDLMEDLNATCKELNRREQYSVAVYLWESVKLGKDKSVSVHENDKCQVCGMFVHQHPEWASKIYTDEKGEKYLAFDGAKDMMKLYFEPKKYEQNDDFKAYKIEVNDYYTQRAIDARKAFYVVGSDVLGPMGNELIPFETESAARSFKFDHKGKAIYKFDELTKEIVCELDGGCE